MGDSLIENIKVLRLAGDNVLSIYACCRSDRSIVKLSSPEGEIAQTAFGKAQPVTDRGVVRQAILAIFVQHIDPCGLQALRGIEVLGASYDQLIIESNENDLSVGEEVSFQLNYSARVCAMTSPFVSKFYTSRQARSLASFFFLTRADYNHEI